ncbi:outer membrane protein assembly factor [Polaribacter sp. BAL334]|uniref:outer membrane protein assembly factor n=1 Tax=Polaribacter sp. BAL334 TaxID=1708178 RepID=UPI0018D2043F|nr:outer membrane protein assembly factor [Polaribacter sp. BAL334]MBG7612598.1 outer membrane protein assembly factor [Polaribacter sp. BAL334]
MKNILFVIAIFLSVPFFSQSAKVGSIDWKGVERMNINFMIDFIETKVNQPLDSIKLNNDVYALTRLNGISNVTYTVAKKDTFFTVTFQIIENWSLLPNVSLWTSAEASAAYRIGLFDYNFLGKNNTIGAYYQNNAVSSFGFFYAAPFLFSTNLGLEASFQKQSSIEPLFINTQPARYEYTNTGIELLAAYRIDFQNAIRFGVNVFSEKYQYLSGATANGVPQFLELTKTMLKSNYTYDNLKYDFYLISGIRNNFFAQYVFSSNNFQDNFKIAWNDFSYFKRLGNSGNWATRVRFGLSSNENTPFAPFALDNNVNIRGVGNLIDRGTGMFVINTEFRNTLIEKNWFVLQGNTFMDAGSWRLPGGNFNDFIDKNNVRFFAGVGLRFIHKTIFNATFRIDYGFGLTERSQGLVFGIGQYF